MPTSEIKVNSLIKVYISSMAITFILAACASNSSPNALPEVVVHEQASTTATALPPASETLASQIATQTQNSSQSVASSTAIATATQTPLPQIPDGDFRSWELFAEGFRQPLIVTNAGDGSGRLFVGEQQGRIWTIANGQILPEPFMDIRGRVNSQADEQGLLGLSFHPRYAENGYFFINYTDLNGNTVVSRFQVSADANRADAASERIVIQFEQPYQNHNGGHLEFGPDGYLYIGMGDGGAAGDPQNRAQSAETLLGALLRLDIDTTEAYAIPDDNPYVNGGGRPEIWAIGLRNPWRFSFDPVSGDLHIGDVGQNIWEEIDFLPAGTAGGANFGWRFFEGSHPYNGEAPSNFSLVAPVAEYAHADSRCSVTGGLVYRGSQLPELWGVYFYGDYCSGEVFALVQDKAGAWQSESVYNLPLQITSFGKDENGEIYLLDRNGGLYTLR